MTGIYKITNEVNGDCYVGQSACIERRLMEHKTPKNIAKGTLLGKAMLEYGVENFKFEVLEECKSELLDELEEKYIAEIKPKYNKVKGGKGVKGMKLSDETRRVLAEHSRKQWERKSPSEKRSIIENNLTYRAKVGHSVSAETRTKISKALTGKSQSEETIRKRAAKISVSMKGNTNRKRDVLAVNLDTLDVEIFPMVLKAARFINTDPTHLVHVLKKQRPICKGWYVTYLCSVETIGDECSQVGLGIDASSKCAASLMDEEIVHSLKMENSRVCDRGFVQLAIRSGQFKTINVVEIREGELVGLDILTGEMRFEAVENREQKPVIGYASYFKLLNGFEKTLYMTKGEMDAHAKRYSQTYSSQWEKVRNSSKWTTDFDAMAKKTALKLLLSKYAPLSVEMKEAYKADQAVIGKDDTYSYVDNPNTDAYQEVEEEKAESANSEEINTESLNEEKPQPQQAQEQAQPQAQAEQPKSTSSRRKPSF